VNRVERLIEVARRKQRVVIGLMSGTSVDAIDTVFVHARLSATDLKIDELLQEKEAMALIATDSISGLDMNVAAVTGGRATVLGKICL
jgi:1,6-anhydro-N-acetylmuramate kinase